MTQVSVSTILKYSANATVKKLKTQIQLLAFNKFKLHFHLNVMSENIIFRSQFSDSQWKRAAQTFC